MPLRLCFPSCVFVEALHFPCCSKGESPGLTSPLSLLCPASRGFFASDAAAQGCFLSSSYPYNQKRPCVAGKQDMGAFLQLRKCNMTVYIISYDLNKNKNYPALYDEIKKLGNWCHPLDSTWLVSTSLKAPAVRDRLRRAMDQDDALLVCKASVDAAWINLHPKVSEWLKAKL